MTEKTLIPAKIYLQTGSHIGAKFKTKGMIPFIFKKRRDKLKVLDVGTIDDRLREASEFLYKFTGDEITVVSQKEYGWKAIRQFAKVTGAKAMTGRFIPGTFTNPSSRYFTEPKVLLVTDPKVDNQAISEATKIRIPVVSLCSTDNETDNIDLIIPINNKGRQSIALAFWLLAREIEKKRENIKSDDDFTLKLEDFEISLDNVKQAKEQSRKKTPFKRGFRKRSWN